jgi:hypothetical protein
MEMKPKNPKSYKPKKNETKNNVGLVREDIKKTVFNNKAVGRDVPLPNSSLLFKK